MLGVYGEEGAFLLRPVGQISWFESVGRTFGTAQLGKLAGLREWVELLERRSVDFDGKGWR